MEKGRTMVIDKYKIPYVKWNMATKQMWCFYNMRYHEDVFIYIDKIDNAKIYAISNLHTVILNYISKKWTKIQEASD